MKRKTTQVSRQKPLFDTVKEGERALHWMDTIAPPVRHTPSRDPLPTVFFSALYLSQSREQTLKAPAAHPQPQDLFNTLLGALVCAAGTRLAAAAGAALPSAASELRLLTQFAAGVLSRPCPYPEEYLALCDQLAVAERAVCTAEWLLQRLPGQAELAEAILKDVVRCCACLCLCCPVVVV